MNNEHKSEGLKLPPGIEEGQLVNAVRASGYPLQTIVALDLLQDGFGVTEEWGYVDRITGEHRALDLFAHRNLENRSDRFDPYLNLLVECKRSELPYVFFASAVPQIPAEYPSIVGFKNRNFSLHLASSGSSRDVSAAEFLKCSEMTFSYTPTIASIFCRAERKGKKLDLSGAVPYNNVVLPMASALDHFAITWSGMSEQRCYYPQISLCVCVIDAPIIVASGTPEAPQLKNESWVRLVRQEAIQERSHWHRSHYVIDAVKRNFLRTYLSQHVLPFVDEITSRITRREELLISGRGEVDDWNDWSWDDLRPTV